MKEECGEGRRGDESASSPFPFSTAAEKGRSSTKPLPGRNGEGVGDGANSNHKQKAPSLS